MPKIKAKNFQAPRGTYDILPEDHSWWEKVRKTAKEIAEDYGFSMIETPIFEDAELFARGAGVTSDLVEKEMYVFRTRGGDHLALRPEGTAGVVRAYLENGMVELPHPVKLFYMGPMFRYERPQAGRYRQHHQFGFEIIGGEESVLDAQIIQLFLHISKQLGLKKLSVHINSIGCQECRPGFRRALVEYYRSKKQKICPDCQRRLKENPLRLLDCKEEKCQSIKAGAPLTLDYLCPACHSHFKSVLEFLDELEVPYFLNHQLVRGLDYYTKTVFEVFFEGEDGISLALGGGGRYDGLVKDLGGKPTSAVGAAVGIERIILLMKEQNVKVPLRFSPKIFLVELGELGQRKSLKLFGELHKEGIVVAESLSKSNIKSQLKIADRLGARYALILGQQEALEGTVIIRDMQSRMQETVPLARVVGELKKRLAKN